MFPEPMVNCPDDAVLPSKIGTVKMAAETVVPLIPSHDHRPVPDIPERSGLRTW